MTSPWLRTCQKTWFLCKDKYFHSKIWLQMLSFLASSRLYKNSTIVTCLFYKLKAYNHIQPEISGRKAYAKHICRSRKKFPSFFLSESLVFGKWGFVYVTWRFVYVSTVLLTSETATERRSMKIALSNFPKYNKS